MGGGSTHRMRLKYDRVFLFFVTVVLISRFWIRFIFDSPVLVLDTPPPILESPPPVIDSQPRRKIAVLSYNDGKNNNAYLGHRGFNLSNATLHRLVRCNHATYAKKYGYAYISHDLETSKWFAARLVLNGLRYKTFMILTYFDDYDIILWIDHDAIFYDMNVSLEYWVDEKMPANATIMMAEDLPGYRFNAGVQIIKTTEWARKFYESAVGEILKTKLDATYLEQPIFYKLHDLLDREKQKIHIFRPRWKFQAFLKVKNELRQTSWIAHASQSGRDLGALIKRDVCTEI